MRRIVLAGVVMTALAAGAAAQGFSRENGRSGKLRGCSVATLQGAYGIQGQGTRPSAPGGPTESAIGVILRVYDGAGQFTQVDNIKGSISGIVPDRPGFGTYEVNEDCTAVTHFEPAPGISLEERMVIVAGGDEVLSIVTNPLPVMLSSRQVRVSAR